MWQPQEGFCSSAASRSLQASREALATEALQGTEVQTICCHRSPQLGAMQIKTFQRLCPCLLPQVLDHTGSIQDRRLAAAAHLEAALVAHTYREPQAAADSLTAASSALGVDIQVQGEGLAPQHSKLCATSMSSCGR